MFFLKSHRPHGGGGGSTYEVGGVKIGLGGLFTILLSTVERRNPTEV